MVKKLPANEGDTRDMDLICGSGRSLGVGNGNPLQYSCLENSIDRGTWSYSPWGHKESDMTKPLSMRAHACTLTLTHTHTHTHKFLYQSKGPFYFGHISSKLTADISEFSSRYFRTCSIIRIPYLLVVFCSK